jgi:hypothetical protein
VPALAAALVSWPTALGAQGGRAAPPADARGAQPVARADSLVRRVADAMTRRYVFPAVGRQVAARLEAAVRAGAYRGAAADSALAARLTRELRAATGDGHLGVEYSAAPIPEADSAAAAEMERRDRDRYYGPRLNYGVQRVELLPGNVGYLDLRVFAPADWGAPVVTAAMTLLARADALVVDLRQNGGGHGETVVWLSSYLADSTPRPLSGTYLRERDATTPSFTLPYVPGPRFGTARPVYVLTSRRTFSAAEAFAYDLQALKRATVVGEPTGGGAHPYENVRLDAHFALGLPIGRSVNPITGGNWQGTGVRPDVAVPADSALAVALRAVGARLGRGTPPASAPE